MLPQKSETPEWLSLLTAAWPILALLAVLVSAYMELRIRKMIRSGIEKSKEDLRTQMQVPIGDIGNDAMKALDATGDHEKRLAKMETKMDFIWRMVERGAADFLKQREKEGD